MPLKLFFDECLSKRLLLKIADVYLEDYPDLQTKHLTEFVDKGTDDLDWLPLLQRDGDWIVITSDAGCDPKKPKLPLICVKTGITHIVMTSCLHRARYAKHKQAILTVWPQIVEAWRVPKGTRISFGFGPYAGRNWPRLTIEGKPFDAWCRAHGILQTADEENPQTPTSLAPLTATPDNDAKAPIPPPTV